MTNSGGPQQEPRPIKRITVDDDNKPCIMEGSYGEVYVRLRDRSQDPILLTFDSPTTAYLILDNIQDCLMNRMSGEQKRVEKVILKNGFTSPF